MTYFNSWRNHITLLLLISVLISCKKKEAKEPPLIVKEDPVQAAKKATEIRKNTAAHFYIPPLLPRKVRRTSGFRI